MLLKIKIRHMLFRTHDRHNLKSSNGTLFAIALYIYMKIRENIPPRRRTRQFGSILICCYLGHLQR